MSHRCTHFSTIQIPTRLTEYIDQVKDAYGGDRDDAATFMLQLALSQLIDAGIVKIHILEFRQKKKEP